MNEEVEEYETSDLQNPDLFPQHLQNPDLLSRGSADARKTQFYDCERIIEPARMYLVYQIRFPYTQIGNGKLCEWTDKR